MDRREIRPISSPADAGHAIVTARGKETGRSGEQPGVILTYLGSSSVHNNTGGPVSKAAMVCASTNELALKSYSYAVGHPLAASSHQWAVVRIVDRRGSTR